ncbi:hypothetical protein L798_09906 [Zootermopsis nevadensis]|uniref:Uncharacterized protein n=1 Tax=Zootermopsis nevadensis TaxID=136037 RepID=A0A067R1A8_ZOONE|nr:hypothetical protein L798_09906 [Zootermopsis nevadensis]
MVVTVEGGSFILLHTLQWVSPPSILRITSILSSNAIDVRNFLATHSLLLPDMVALLQFINIKQLLLQNSGRTTTQTRLAHSFQHIQCVNKKRTELIFPYSLIRLNANESP